MNLVDDYIDDLTRAGARASANGRDLDDCPHPEGSAEAEYWIAGWMMERHPELDDHADDCGEMMWTS